jgi:hypothetical protein
MIRPIPSPEFICELPVFAASGLIIRDGIFYIVSDDEVSLLHGSPKDGFKAYPLWDEVLPEDPATRKKLKPDFECLALKGASLFILPSFSKKNRITGVRVDLTHDGICGHQILDLTDLRENLTETVPDINIEGAMFLNNELLLFQRGNGKNGTNAVIRGKDFNDTSMKIIPLTLPHLGKVPMTITDVAYRENEIWFLAVAEDTESTYLDGEVLGSFLGRFDQSFGVKDLFKLELPHKPEGLAFSQDGFLYMVTDDDSRNKPSRLFRINI